MWLASGYAIAWASEFSSINNGFPYGEYHYIYENMPGELMVFGVPFFDSLSYPFLIFAGFATAEYILTGNSAIDWLRSHTSIKKAFVGALLTTSLDVIIDPAAKLGKQWFLGEIYYYTNDGGYFGVPLSNFGGWFLISFTVIAFNILAWKAFPKALRERPIAPYRRQSIICPIFYISIALFNIAVTYWIGATELGFASTAILCAVAVYIFSAWKKKARRAPL